jgi:hypothetical protein
MRASRVFDLRDFAADFSTAHQQIVQSVINLIDLAPEIFKRFSRLSHKARSRSPRSVRLPCARLDWAIDKALKAKFKALRGHHGCRSSQRLRGVPAAVFRAEAEWLEKLLRLQKGDDLSPLLNIGSSTRAFREQEQPWTERCIFAPLKARGVRVLHLDNREGDGIDIRADILSPAQLPGIKAWAPKSVLCCNILEHVTDPAALARTCIEIVGPGGLIFVTVPFSYPHHRDPIDTMYRPSPHELAALFHPAVMLNGEILDTGESWWNDVRNRPWILFRPLLRMPFPFIDFAGWQRSMRRMYWLWHPYRVTAAVFRVPQLAGAIVDMGSSGG